MWSGRRLGLGARGLLFGAALLVPAAAVWALPELSYSLKDVSARSASQIGAVRGSDYSVMSGNDQTLMLAYNYGVGGSPRPGSDLISINNRAEADRPLIPDGGMMNKSSGQLSDQGRGVEWVWLLLSAVLGFNVVARRRHFGNSSAGSLG